MKFKSHARHNTVPSRDNEKMEYNKETKHVISTAQDVESCEHSSDLAIPTTIFRHHRADPIGGGTGGP